MSGASPHRAVVLAPAKINLTLDIVGVRPDGYHTVDMLMQTVDLYDRVTVERTDDGALTLCLPDSDLPRDAHNTAYRAATAFFEAAGVSCSGVRLTVEKRIPMQAGMAGGSADAAGVLAGLNVLWRDAVSAEALYAAAASVGADVPFCLYGGAARATGIGTTLTPAPPLPPDTTILIIKPAFGVSTAEAYCAVDTATLTRRPDTAAMLDALERGDLAAIGALLCNTFEEALALPAPEVIRRAALQAGGAGCVMTGSGSAVFALFKQEQQARACRAQLQPQFPESYLCRPCTGVQIDCLE